MKKFIIPVAILCASICATAQVKSPVADLDYTFTTVKANPITSVKNQAKSTVNGLSDAYTATIMKSHQAHTSGCISNITLHCHICHHIASILNIGSFTEWRIRS